MNDRDRSLLWAAAVQPAGSLSVFPSARNTGIAKQANHIEIQLEKYLFNYTNTSCDRESSTLIIPKL